MFLMVFAAALKVVPSSEMIRAGNPLRYKTFKTSNKTKRSKVSYNFKMYSTRHTSKNTHPYFFIARNVCIRFTQGECFGV